MTRWKIHFIYLLYDGQLLLVSILQYRKSGYLQLARTRCSLRAPEGCLWRPRVNQRKSSRGQCWFVHTCVLASWAGREPVAEVLTALWATAFKEMNNEQWLVGGIRRIRRIKMNARQSEWRTGRTHECVEPSSVTHSKNHIISTEVVNCVHSHNYLSVSLTSFLGVHRIHRIYSDVKSHESETAVLQLWNIEWEWGRVRTAGAALSLDFSGRCLTAVIVQHNSGITESVQASQGRPVKCKIRKGINLEQCSP